VAPSEALLAVAPTAPKLARRSARRSSTRRPCCRRSHEDGRAAPDAGPGPLLLEQCVDRVLARLARAGADEAQIGPTVLSQCDGPLRAALADAIQSGEAPLCTVESCMGMARSRASDEAKNADSASDAAECAART
jgi:hypothetical protein